MNVEAFAISGYWMLAQTGPDSQDAIAPEDFADTQFAGNEARTLTDSDAKKIAEEFGNILFTHRSDLSVSTGKDGAAANKELKKDDNNAGTKAEPAWYHKSWDSIRVDGIQFGIKLAIAFLVFYFGRKAARFATNLVSGLMEKVGTDPILVKFAANLLYCSLLVMIVMASLDKLGVNVTGVGAMIATAGLAVGLALQGSLANFAAGIMLIIFKPFGVSDEVEAGGETGNVEEVNIFNTILRTNGNVKIIIPNGQITTGTIKNFTAQRIRLIELKIGCGYCDDLKAVKSFLDKLVRGDVRIVTTPPPAVSVSELSDFSVVFSVKCWVSTKEFGEVRSVLLERIKLGFDENGFTFPYPSRDVYVHQASLGIAKAA